MCAIVVEEKENSLGTEINLHISSVYMNSKYYE